MILQTDVMQFSEDAVARASGLIKSGHIVAVPTETVYGLAADATSDAAVAKIYAVKERPCFNPLIIHVADSDAAMKLGIFDTQACELATRYWPGPLTIVVPLRPDAGISSLATAGLRTIAIRVPAHRAMQALLARVLVPLAAPSANASGTISPTRAAHVLRTLDGHIPLIVDDGPTDRGIESTIIAVDEAGLRLLRAGPIEIADTSLSMTGKIEAPGQTIAHYAPSKPLRVDATCGRDNEILIGFGPVAGDTSLSVTGDLEEAAARLFDLLHRADAGPSAGIAVAPVPEKGLGIAINDRLRRAAAGARP